MIFTICFWNTGVFATDWHNDNLKNIRNLWFDSKVQKLMAPSAGEPENRMVTILLIPEFHYSDHGNLKTVLDGTALKASSGYSTVGSITFMATKPITDWFSLSFMYQYGNADYNGGNLVVDAPNFAGSSEITVEAQLAGFLGDFKSKSIGNIQVSLLEVWDIYRGSETTEIGGVADIRSVNAFDDRVFSFLIWWDKDFAITDSWTIDPYLGWRSVKVNLMDMNDWTKAQGELKDDSSWTHLVALGAKLKYNNGSLGFYTRLGLNYRVTEDDVFGYTSRAVAPGVVNLGFMTSWDRTVGSWGIGINYFVPNVCVLDIGYNGAAGKDTLYHTLSLALIFPF
jgi:hypothetical protein